jgi:flagellar motility protein MotE (MotC chaperone)
MSGYDKFFKEAGKASGLVTGKSAPKAKFKLRSEGGKNMGAKSSKATAKNRAGDSGVSQARDRIAIGTPEDQLRREIAIRSRQKKAASMKKRQAFPVFPAIVAMVALLSCGVGYFQPDLVDQAINGVSQVSGIEISAFGSANAATAEAKGKKEAAAKGAASEQKAGAHAAVKGDSVAAGVAAGAVTGAGAENVATPVATTAPADIRTWSDEELSFFNKLNDRKKELDLREAELAKLEEELQKQKLELDGKIKQLETMREDISKTLKTRVAVDQEKVERLVQTYSTMKAQNAAKIIETLNEDLAVEVMDKMKKKSAAEIMNMMDAKKARRISELLTGYQRSPATAAAASDEEAPAAEAAENAAN